MEQATIFGKAMASVTYQDVVDFCARQIKEGINLDYKRDLSSKSLLKTMAAFANTRGGFIIVGVSDEDDKPKLPVEGIAWHESLSLTVTSSIVDNMYPFLGVQVHVCEPVNNKTFLVIQVPESHETPHWLFNKSELYVRRDDRSGHTNWERFATESEWEFLRNKREKSISLRDQALGDARKVYATEYRLEASASDPLTPFRINYNNMLVTTVVPMFPRQVIADTLQLMNYMNSESIPSILRGYTYPSAMSTTKIFQEGAYRYKSDGKPEHFNALTRFGVVANYERSVAVNFDNVGESVWFSHILESIEKTLRYAGLIYEKIGYEGSLLCSTELNAANNVALIFQDGFDARRLPRNITGEFLWEAELTNRDITNLEMLRDVLRDAMTEFSRAFGFTGDINPHLDRYLGESSVYSQLYANQT